MSRSVRLFDLLQALRRHRRAVSANTLAEELGVSKRTIYRDIDALIALGAPIDGEAGIGYLMRPGFVLPPLMFTEDEAEAIAVAMRLLARTGDTGLQKAADSVLSKLTLVVPDLLRGTLTSAVVYVSKAGAPVPEQRDLPSTVRHAIRGTRKMRIAYQDGEGTRTLRVIQPFAVEYYVEATLVCAWCELRNDIRHFRTDRIVAAEVLDEKFAMPEAVIAEWAAAHNDR